MTEYPRIKFMKWFRYSHDCWRKSWSKRVNQTTELYDMYMYIGPWSNIVKVYEWDKYIYQWGYLHENKTFMWETKFFWAFGFWQTTMLCIRQIFSFLSKSSKKEVGNERYLEYIVDRTAHYLSSFDVELFRGRTDCLLPLMFHARNI